MIKKSINTFAGGIDQDTDITLVPNNTYLKAKHFGLTKFGKEGVASTLKGFEELSESININASSLNYQVYTIRLNSSISNGDRIFVYNDGTNDLNFTATSDINNSTELKNQIDTQFGANVTTFVFLNEVYLEFTDLTTIVSTGVYSTYGYFTLAQTIPTGTAMFDYTDGVTTTTFTAPTDITTVAQLTSVIDSNFTGSAFTVTFSGLGAYTYHFLEGIHIENIRSSFITEYPGYGAINSISQGLVITNDVGNNNNFELLGLKEISLNSDERLIFIFKKDLNNALYIQIFYYNETNRQALNTGYISKLNSSSEQIISDNIIYNKRSNTDHSLYWCEGANSDKVINFSISIDPNDYNDWNTYIETLKLELFEQSRYNFEQTKNDFLPQPQINSFYELTSTTNGLKSGEAVICFYKLRNSNDTSHLSFYSSPLYVTSRAKDPSSILFPYLEEQGVMYPNSRRFGAKFTISNIQSVYYDQLEPYFVHYTQGQTGFKVLKAPTQQLSEDIELIYLEDYDNTTYEEVELTDLVNLQNLNNISLTQTVYKNRRIKANVKSSVNQTLEDFDARAYRFNDLGICKLYDIADNETYSLDSSVGTIDFSLIDKKADAVNKFNDEYSNYSDWKTNQQYKYQSDGQTLGGTGLNISYVIGGGFGGEDVQFSNPTDLYNPGTGTLSGGSEHFLVSESQERNRGQNPTKGFMPGEVYRFFICFWKGDTPTLSKWIGDIKFPEDSGAYNLDDSATANNIQYPATGGTGIRFNVDTSSIKDEITGFSIGYVPRENEDKSVIFNSPNLGLHSIDLGGANDMYFHGNASYIKGRHDFSGSGIPTDYNATKKVLAFPFSLTKSKIWDSFGDTTYYMKPLLNMNDDCYFYESGTNHRKNIYVPYTTDSSTKPTDQLIEVKAIQNLDDSVELNPYLTLSNTVNVKNQSIVGSTIIDTNVGDNFEKTIIVLDSVVTDYNSQSSDQILFTLRRHVVNQYGGNGYVSRKSNDVYLSSYTKIDGKSSFTDIRIEGDVFNCMTDIRLQSGTDSSSNEVYRGAWWCIESTTNFHRMDYNYEEQKRFFPTVSPNYTTAMDNDRLNQIDDNLLVRVLNASISEINNENNNLMLISNKKIEGIIDNSWEIFPENNQKIIDPNLGDILNLLRFEDRLIVFQQLGIAQQYIDQVQQQIDDISKISLGTGDVAGQHIYLLRDIGIQSPEHAIEIDGDILFRDQMRSKIYTIKQGEIKGLSELLRKDTYNGLLRNILYDKESNLAFIPNYVDYLDSSDSYHIIYDNRLKKFVNDNAYVADNGNLNKFTGLTNLISLNGGTVSIYNQNNYLSYPSSINIPQIQFVVNPEPNNVKIFDNLLIDYETITYDGDNLPVDDYNHMPTFITFETEYQSKTLSVSSSNMQRRGRNWRVQIPRSIALNGTDTANARFRGHWMKVTLTFPIADKEIKLNSVTTTYRDTNLM